MCHGTEWDCEGKKEGGLRSDAKEMMGTRRRHSETEEAEEWSLGNVWFIGGPCPIGNGPSGWEVMEVRPEPIGWC